MFFIARRNLFQEKTRLFISIGGVAFSVLLMIILQALSIGISNVLGQYFTTVQADIWVAKINTGNIMDPSFLPLERADELRRIDGVEKVIPFGMQAITTDVNGKMRQFYLISSNDKDNLGRPNRVSQGKASPGPGEIVIDRIIAKSDNVKLGNTIPLGSKRLRVVGFSEGSYLLSTSFAFVNTQDAKSYSLPGTTNYFTVTLKPGADVSKVQSDINKQVPGVYAHTKGHFIQVNVNVVKDIVKPIFGALVILGALIGIAVIGLTIFTSTIEKAKEYGILKAIGLTNGKLYTVVLEQALIAATTGYLIGAVLALGLNPLLTSAVPQFVTQIRPFDMAWIFAVTLLMAVIATYIPMRRLNKIDPAEVFRA